METNASSHPPKGMSIEEELVLIRGPRDKQPIYKQHDGTIRVSKGTLAWRCGLAAFHQFRKGTRPVEFVFIGVLPGGQAIKACNVAQRAIRTYLDFSVGFSPIWAMVEITNADGSKQLQEATILRIMQLKDDIQSSIEGLPVIV